MVFKVIPIKEVLEYLEKYVFKSDDKDRRKAAKLLVADLAAEKVTAYYGFVNEYGERALALGRDLKEWWWAGDESDWEFADSYLEGSFVNELLETHRAHIVKRKR